MWNKDFEISIFNSLEKIPAPCTNECYKAEFEGNQYFVKKVNLRSHESIDEAQTRAEITETISAHYNQHGIKTIVAVRQNNSYSHVNDIGVWLAYPWSSAQTINGINADICFKIGQLLAQIHQKSPNFNYLNTTTSINYIDFSWIEKVDHNNFPEVAELLPDPQALKSYATQCYENAIELQKKSHSIISHGDMHTKNILFDNQELIVIDWELSGDTIPEVELFDVALDWCNFCKYDTQLPLFDSIIQGYCQIRPINGTKDFYKLVIDSLALCILDHFSINIIKYIQVNDNCILEKAKQFLSQYYELNAYEKKFINIMSKYAQKNI